MSQTLKYPLLRLTIIAVMLFLELVAVSVPAQISYADANSDSCARLQGQFDQLNADGSLATNPKDATASFPKLCTTAVVINKAITILSVGAGVSATLFLIIGGFLFLTSAGNQEQAEKGKKTLLYAIIGLIIVVLATVIVKVVINLLIT
jgi:hypothetical protein